MPFRAPSLLRSPCPAWPARGVGLAAAALAAALSGCALPTVQAPRTPPPVGAAPMPAPAPGAAAAGYAWSGEMDAAASRLRSGLRGSPIDIAQTTDQRLWLSLPGDEAFAPGRAALKPGAGAWLDQVAAALKQAPRATVQIVGPAAKGGSALALDRAASARDWIVMRGVSPMRMTVAAATPGSRGAGADGRLDILIGERGGR